MENLFKKQIIFWLCLFAFTLRFWGIADFKTYSGDESYHVPALENYVETGHLEEWMHPPMKYFLLQGSMDLFGNNPYGWRMKNVLFGSLTVFALFLLGKVLFEDTRVAVTSALLLAIDPLHLAISRSTYGEIPSGFFFILAVYITARFIKGEIRSPLMAGALIGLAIADRWYFLVPLAALLAFTTACIFRERRWLGVAHLFAVYVILPLGIYIASFFLWFGKGHTVPEFFQMQIDMYKELQALQLGNFQSQFAAFLPSSPWTWFIRPLVSFLPVEQNGAWGRFFVIMNNPPVWLLALPAIAYLAYCSWRDRNRWEALVLLLFASTYLQFVLVKRPVFLYSALVVLPFACLAVAGSLTSLLRTLKDDSRPYLIAMLLICLWGLYLYPFITMRSVPVLLYTPLLALGKTL